MRESPETTRDRRQAPRMKLVEIAYIGMGPENGGVVLNVSDGGLAFRAVAPVQPDETIHFSLSLRGHSRFEGAGNVVWTNEMRTVCGLRFTSLADGGREQLNDWANQSRMPVAARENTLAPTPQTESPASDASPLDSNAGPVFAISPAAKAPLSNPEIRTLRQTPFFRWIMFGLLSAALTVAAFNYGVYVGKSETSSVARSAANPGSPASPPISAPIPVPDSSIASDATSVPTGTPAAPSDAPVDASKTGDTSGSTVQRPGPEGNGAAVPDRHAAQELEAGKSELAAALAYLNGNRGQRDSSLAVPLLWAAVGNGNSTAEVMLADLYVHGDGVAKNCEQGRILLIAASRSGNAQADVKLGELNTNGCP